MNVQRRTGLSALAIVGCALVSAGVGCLMVQVNPPHDSYYEHDGMWCSNYPVSVAQARFAAIAALTELKMPLYQEGPLHHGLFLDTKTSDEFETRILIMPARHGGAVRIGVRVGGFGTHRQVCTRLQEAIARHLDDVPIVPGLPVTTMPVTGPAPDAPVQAQQPPQPALTLPPQPLPLPLENKTP